MKDNTETGTPSDDVLIIGGSGDAMINFDSYGAATYTISSGTTTDTITLNNISNTGLYHQGIGSVTVPSTSITNNTGGYSLNGTGYTWTNTTSPVHINSQGIDMAVGTDLKIDGKSLKEFMTKMEERLAILVPDPAKLEKFEALKKAYENYKLMEKLCQEEAKNEC